MGFKIQWTVSVATILVTFIDNYDLRYGSLFFHVNHGLQEGLSPEKRCALWNVGTRHGALLPLMDAIQGLKQQSQQL